MKKALIFLLLVIGSVSYAQLTGPITDRPAATSLSNTDLFYVVQGANDKKLTYQVLKSELFDFGDEVTFGDIVLFADTIYFTSKTAGIYRDVDTLMFFDPTGVYKLYELADTGSGGGGGNGYVDISGTPTAGHLAEWTDANTIKESVAVVSTGSSFGFGNYVLENITTGASNVAIGNYSLSGITSGTGNVAVGPSTGLLISTGDGNSVFGHDALAAVTTQSGNTALGSTALNGCTGGYNIGLGYYAGQNLTAYSNKVVINSLQRSSIAGDTTESIIYGHQSSTTSNQKIYFNANAYIKHYTHLGDSIFYDYLTNIDVDDGYYASFTVNGAIIANAFEEGAGFGLTMELPTLTEHLSDTVGGEIPWYYTDKKGVVIKTHDLRRKSPAKIWQAHQAAIEMNFRYTLDLQKEVAGLKEKAYEQEERNRRLENRVTILEELLSRMLTE